MSIILPLAAIPAVLIREAMMGVEPSDALVASDAPLSEIAIAIGWFAVPLAFAAIHLWRYRGGATMLPLFGRGWVNALLALASLLLSALFLLAAAVGTEVPEPHGWPFAIWFTAAALYFQALRAAAVRRSLADKPSARDELVKVFD
ncbi:hypothetical protein M9978_01610 [Sphingomonas sp. MG17]|uniref:Uncharacterized protein n=1 Tax=Sphingomonas tagetis TaxID=2949092 RepID=A0A9X2HE22_9SPHN|nr:hypothetical protein [Sphingomonas tagetis]MCP3729113.1 hypothetical protein [Sphingomonas tagetis]